MPDISAIAAALSSFKAAKDIAQSMVGLHDAAAFQAKLLEFQSKLIDANNAAFAAQDERAALLDQIRKLEKQVADLKAWEAEKHRYQLTEIGPAAFANVVKENMRGSDPMHCICSQCYDRGQKSVLQSEGNFYGTVTLACPQCGSKVKAVDSHPGYPFKGHKEVREAAQTRSLSALQSSRHRYDPFA